MSPLVDQLAKYSAYHRNTRNIATHLLGVPLIVVAVATLLSRPTFGMGALALSPATLGAAAAALYYLRLDLRFGIVMTLLLALSVLGGEALAAQSTAIWLGCGMGMFVLGWVIQFVGHYYEGRKPAFADDLIGLLIGPLFVTAEIAFFLGMRLDLHRAVEMRAGPVRRRA